MRPELADRVAAAVSAHVWGEVTVTPAGSGTPRAVRGMLRRGTVAQAIAGFETELSVATTELHLLGADWPVRPPVGSLVAVGAETFRTTAPARVVDAAARFIAVPLVPA